ncbi:chorismate-binding protein [Thauera sinica]|uniref:Chorismate-binding protein n=1 Tax=Thauera sinica TaxID=2665146 RepID=A0ABW1AL75_9RHOO|nr:chorismate-binding protein [Thauera sp. K11]ATE60772.1 chloride transporter [Thauera sp. K11]
MDCFALLDDCAATAAEPASRLYTGFVRECRCDDPARLDEAWAEADREIRAGRHAVVLADYEWGARLLHAGDGRLAPAQHGALCFLIFSSLRRLSAAGVDAWLAAKEGGPQPAGGGTVAGPAPAGVLDIRPSVDRDAFHRAIGRIHAAIREGETYQVNYTYRLDFRAFGAPASLYRRLRARQPVAYGAFIALPPSHDGPTHILSCSPELFLCNRGGHLEARPMKGTASRAGVPEGDSEIARMLGGDAKNRAENLMIVDLLRNDLGRIARTGSVRVPALFSVESYPTVFQMTSTISAELPADAGFADLLRALFPCGSITGAPKHRTMQLIAELESTPRGLYTGGIGWIDAPAADRAAACGDFCLSVAIRTLTLDAPAQAGMRPGRLGIGAGIVIDSRADDEYEECRLKARFLTGLDPGFALFETMHATREAGVRHLDRHLGRLAGSAEELGFALPAAGIRAALDAQVAALAAGQAFRVRLALHKDGHFDIVVAPLDPLPDGPVSLLVAAEPVDGADPLLRHKTTLRGRYDASVAEAARRGAFDTLFHNGAGELTEGGRSNVFLLVDGGWVTPPLAAGVLPGVMRGVLLEDPALRAREARLTLADLYRAERIVVCNALRGAREAWLAVEGRNSDA